MFADVELSVNVDDFVFCSVNETSDAVEDAECDIDDVSGSEAEYDDMAVREADRGVLREFDAEADRLVVLEAVFECESVADNDGDIVVDGVPEREAVPELVNDAD